MFEQIIRDKINNNFNVNNLVVINNSMLHKGHLGDNGSNETHFKIILTLYQDDFTNNKKINIKDKLNIQRKINKILLEEFRSGLHALEIEINFLPIKEY